MINNLIEPIKIEPNIKIRKTILKKCSTFKKRTTIMKTIEKKNYSKEKIEKLVINNRFQSINNNKRISYFNNNRNYLCDIKNISKTSLENIPNYKNLNKFKNSFHINKKDFSVKYNFKSKFDFNNNKLKKKSTKSFIRKTDIINSKELLNNKILSNELNKFKSDIENHYSNIKNSINLEFNNLEKKLIDFLNESKNNNKTRIINEKNNNMRNINEVKNLLTDKESYLTLYKFLNFFEIYKPLNLITSSIIKFDDNKKNYIIKTIKNIILNNRIEPPKYFPSEILRYFENKINQNIEEEIKKGGDMIEWFNNNYYNKEKIIQNGKKKFSLNSKRISSKNIIENKIFLRNNYSSSKITRKNDKRITSFLKKPILIIKKVLDLNLFSKNLKVKKSPIIKFIDENVIFISNINIIKIYKIINEFDIKSNSSLITKDPNLVFKLKQSINILEHFKNKNQNKYINYICIWTREIDKKKVLSISLKSKVI